MEQSALRTWVWRSCGFRPWGMLFGVSGSFPTKAIALLLGESWAYEPEQCPEAGRPDRGNMITSSNGNIFRVTGPLCGNSPHKGQWRGALMFSLICVWINGWVNKREAGDLRRRRDHYDVNVMKLAAVGDRWVLYISSESSRFLQVFHRTSTQSCRRLGTRLQ